MKPRVLVVGARKNSIGEAIAVRAEEVGLAVVKVGISGEEDHELDLLADSSDRLVGFLQDIDPFAIVSTVGLNMPKPSGELADWYRWHFETNVTANMRLLAAYRQVLREKGWGGVNGTQYAHYVAISSNSARIPRTRSAAYCASKAALSMAVRVEAREALTAKEGLLAYVYEPGLLAGTPMTEEAARKHSGPLTRMRGVADKGLRVKDFAQYVVGNLVSGGVGLSGARLSYDCDEL